jgi:hypothetical protein
MRTHPRVTRHHLLHFSPCEIFVVAPVQQRIDLSTLGAPKYVPTFHSFAEENVWSLGDQQYFGIASLLRE